MHIIDLLFRFGASLPTSGGAERVYFDFDARNAIQNQMGGKRGIRAIEKWFNTCAIVTSRGLVITLYRT